MLVQLVKRTRFIFFQQLCFCYFYNKYIIQYNFLKKRGDILFSFQIDILITFFRPKWNYKHPCRHSRPFYAIYIQVIKTTLFMQFYINLRILLYLIDIFIISGHMGLSLLREDTVLDMLGLAHQFNLQDLETAISDYLRQVLALRNVCSVLDAARWYILLINFNIYISYFEFKASKIGFYNNKIFKQKLIRLINVNF